MPCDLRYPKLKPQMALIGLIYLHMRKRKWPNKLTGEIYSYRLELPVAEGTRLSSEFVAFFKYEG